MKSAVVPAVGKSCTPLLKDTTLQQLTDKTGLSAKAVNVLEKLWNKGTPPEKNVQFNSFIGFDFPVVSQFHPQYVIECMLSDDYFIRVFPIALLRYCEMKYTHRNELEKYSENTDIPSYSVKLARYMLLEEVQHFIDKFYENLISVLDERNAEYKKIYEKEREQNGEKD